MADHPFSSPFDWCDRRCERCPLTSRCAVFASSEQHRRNAAARGENPDDLVAAIHHVSHAFEGVTEMPQEDADDQGIYLVEPLPAPVVPIGPARVQRAARRLVAAVCRETRARSDELLFLLVAILAMKCARICTPTLDGRVDDDDELFEHDVAPNLLVIEAVRDELRLLCSADWPGTFDAELRAFDRAFRPQRRRVGPETRRVMSELRARREAPSPFCTTDDASYRDEVQTGA